MLPRIDIVIIGLNSARTLSDCIVSVKDSHYPQDRISIVYADGGSTDGSQALAEGLGVRVLNVVADTPSPGRQRNAGWQAGSGDLVQFLDSDTVLDPDWLATGAAALTDGIGAVSGNVRERYPEKSVFNWIGDKEWNAKAGEARAFGGIVLVRRPILVETGGYNQDLIAGEDPELAYRFRKAGHKLMKLDVPMVLHDLAMYKVKQYWKRSYRTGHAYAEVNAMHPDFWAAEVRRITLRTGAFLAGLAFLPAAVFIPWLAAVPVLTTLFLFRPRLSLVGWFMKDKGLTRPEARLYTWHISVIVVPQFFGMVRFWWGRLTGNPLQNKKRLIKKK